MRKKQHPPYIVNSVSVILQQGNILGQLENLRFQLLLNQTHEEQRQGKACQLPPSSEKERLAMDKVRETYCALQKSLLKLEKSHPHEAREAATILVEKLNAVCQVYREGQYPKNGVTRTPDAHSQQTKRGQPSKLLKALEDEFKETLTPLIKAHPIAKATFMAACGFIGAIALVALCMTAILYLPSFIPALKPVATALGTPLITNGFFTLHSTPLFSVGNVVSSGVGFLLGAGCGFFGLRQCEASYFKPLKRTINAIQDFTEELPNNNHLREAN